jgi:hypothetical protein
MVISKVFRCSLSLLDEQNRGQESSLLSLEAQALWFHTRPSVHNKPEPGAAFAVYLFN